MTDESVVTARQLHKAYSSGVSLDSYVRLRSVPASHDVAMYVLQHPTNYENVLFYLEKGSLIDGDFKDIAEQRLNLEMYLQYRYHYSGDQHKIVVEAMTAGLSFTMYDNIARGFQMKSLTTATAYLKEFTGRPRDFGYYAAARYSGASPTGAVQLSSRPHFAHFFHLLNGEVSVTDLLDFRTTAIERVRANKRDEDAGPLCGAYAILRLSEDDRISHEEAKFAALEWIDANEYVEQRIHKGKDVRTSLKLAQQAWERW